MAAEIQVSDAVVIVNNEVVAVVPNSVKFTEGFGEQKVRAASVGGGKVETVHARDLESSLSKVMFELMTTIGNVKLARSWKANFAQNVIQVSGSTPDGDINRTFTNATITNDYEVEIGSEGNISIEAMANPAI